MNNQANNNQGDRAPHKRAPDKNVYGKAKLERIAAEHASRRDEHAAAAVEHDRATALSRQKFKYFCDRKERFNGIHDKAEAEIVALREKIEECERKKVEMTRALGELEEKEGEAAAVGEKAAEVSEKYRRYLEMESDELEL